MSTLFCSNTEITPYMERLARYCDDRLDLQKAELNDEYFYQSLPLCVIDSVYSIGVKYEGTRNTVKKYCDYYGLRRIRKDRTALPERGMQESLKEFLDKLKSSGIDFFADQVFRNRQRTSTRSGILKCEAVFKFAQCLHRYGVDCFQDIHHVVHEKRFENEIKSIPGQASGISLSYFFMLSGSDDLIKPDRWIIDFIKDALGVTCSPSCAQTVLVGSCEILKAQYPTVSPRLLDNTIWKHQTGKKDKKTRQRALTCVSSRSGGLTLVDLNIGPFDRSEIVLCSADAGPGSQQQDKDTLCKAEYSFPGAKWVRTIGNSARRQNCKFVILTTAHGMVNPDNMISPYDRHIEDHKEFVLNKWQATIPTLLGGKGCRILIFYSGGSPRDPMLEVMAPILNGLGINILSFGRPNMWDIGKIDRVVELLEQGTSMRELSFLLKAP